MKYETQMYYESVSRGTLLKRRSTRHVSEITAIASEFGNSAKIIVPRSWLGRRVIAFLHSEYISKYPEEGRKRCRVSLYCQQYNSLCRKWTSGLCNGICSEKDSEMDANHNRLFGWDVLCWSSTVAKVWLCEHG